LRDGVGAAEPFSQRFTATFSDGGNTITGRWEIADDRTNYTADFDLIYRRVDTQRRITDILYVGCDPATAAKRATVPGQSTLGIDANHTRITTRPNDVAGNGHVAPERHHDWRHAVRLADPADQGRSEPSFGAPTGLDAVQWARRMEKAGAGEILLTSMDRDGTRDGFDIALTRAVSDAVGIPVIASGGVGTAEHFAEGVLGGGASAVLAASVFHFGDLTVRQVKEHMRSRGIEVRS